MRNNTFVKGILNLVNGFNNAGMEVKITENNIYNEQIFCAISEKKGEHSVKLKKIG